MIISETVLRPILTYGYESWILTTKSRSKIQPAERRALRIIKGVTRRDTLGTVNIRNELGVMSVLDFAEQAQLRWFGHVMRTGMVAPRSAA